MLMLWVVQVRWPQLGYPSGGAIACMALAVLTVLLAFWGGSGAIRGAWAETAAPVLGVLFVMYVLVRWIVAGAPSVGNDEFGTITQAAAWAAGSYWIFSKADVALRRQMARAFLRVVSLIALLCGIHAALQYFWLYQRSYVDLMQSLAAREPTPLEAGLLHHFQLRRVASVWGDPNILAGFSAISLISSLALIRRGRRNAEPGGDGSYAGRADAALGWAAVVAAVVAVVLSGSRGGMVEGLIIILVFAAGFIRKRSVQVGAAVAVLLCVVGGQSQSTSSEGDGVRKQSGWSWRSNTIEERVNYARVGAAMFKQAPLFGLGLGSVDLYFGRFKPAQAREAKYLHNWVLQLLAETGLVGLLLVLGFLSLLFYNVSLTWGASEPELRAIACMAALFVLDALVQLSFSHREMMAFFGLCCGISMQGAAPAGEGRRSVRRLFFASGLAAALVWLVVPRLVAAGYRMDAQDALEQGATDSSRQLLRKAQMWEPSNPATLLQLGEIEESQGQLSSAKLLMEKAIALQPESAAGHAALARVLSAVGDFQHAESEISEALERYPSSAVYNGQMSQLLIRAGRKAEALEYAKRASEYSPGVPGAEHWPAYYATLKAKAAK